MSVVYSPLCDTNERAYLAYCLANYVSSVEKLGGVCGRDDFARCVGGGVDVNGNVDVDDGDEGSTRRAWMGVLSGVGVGVRGGGDVSGGVGSGREEGAGVGERATVHTGGSGSGGDGGSGCEAGGRRVGVTWSIPDAQGQVEIESVQRGKHYRRNKARRERAREARGVQAGSASSGQEVPEWRRGAPRVTTKTPSLSASVCTVDSRTAEEIEAARTLAVRRTAENKVAAAVAQHRLRSLQNKDKTEALMRLQVARIEEQVNTTRAKSQASYKKCGSPIESVGSAMSAGEFGWKQELRKRKALQTKLEYVEAQNMELCKYASAEGLRIVSQMPEPYIPTDEEIEAEDEDISPYPSMEEMRAHAAAMCGDDYPW